MEPGPLEQHIETWPLSRIVEYARNPRKNDAAVDRMCASMREFGFKIPCLVRSDGELIDGHLRLKAARSLGLREIPVMLCDEWTAEQVKAFRLLVNRSATWADFDDELLGLELQDIQGADFDLSLTGFDAGEIDDVLATAPFGRGPARDYEEPDLSQAEACAATLPNPAVSRSGDLWLCGPHRVLCGDATSGEAVTRLLGERQVRWLATDLPYSYVDVIVQRWQALTGKQATLDGDGRSFEQVVQDRSGEGPDAAA
jgi:hypothetical protein